MVLTKYAAYSYAGRQIARKPKSSRLQHAAHVSSGNPVHRGIFACVALVAASQAGRVGEDGSGAMWIAPELIQPPAALADCSHTSEPHDLELVFEAIELGETELDLSRLAAAGSRRSVAFEWNPATGELSFSGTVPAPVFNDLQSAATQGPALLTGNCGAH
jgi:hypothetical protein